VIVGAVSAGLGVHPHGRGLAGWEGSVLAWILYPGFVLPLGAELLLVMAWSARSEGAGYHVLLAAPAVEVCMALAVGVTGPAGPALLLLGTAFLVGWFIILLQYVYRHKQLEPRSMRFFVEAGALSVLAGAGWFLWALDSNPFVLVASMLIAPFVLVRVVLGPSREGPVPERIPWLLRPFWVFQLLLFTFLAEFFLGALLDLDWAGRGFLQYIPFTPLGSPGVGALGPAVYDGLWFAAAILASAWFLIAIGVTMGALVVFRIRGTHEPAQRYRMGLMLGVYALAAVFLPSIASSTPLVSNQYLSALPVIGWGFGLRAGGPFESGAFLAILVMYASVGVLTVLFGRKALCSVMCGAALMYHGTTVHEMRQFNQSSRVGRYFLGSQLSTAYTIASTLALVSLFATSWLAYFHSLPTVQVANGQFDTSALPLPIELYFGAIWFVMFVSTPYIGTYNCATTGFCHWGALSLPFARVSLFRLKVKDRNVCRACTTFDCAKACPVGLVDMPLHFRTTGEFRSTKCCGVGDCIGACPYGNMYQQDVRFWVLRGLRRGRRPSPGPSLPMAHRPAASPPTANASAEALGGGSP
jgi:hypothetical protein